MASGYPTILVDSNVLLDVVSEDSRWYDWSSDALERAAEAGILVINPLVLAEVSIRYASIDDMNAAFPETLIRREPLPWNAAFLAGKAFLKYRRHGGRKTTPLPDFYIGAHAVVQRYTLLTRDDATYRKYFPTLRIVSPK